MIELRNVTKYYPIQSGVRYILRDVTLEIPGTNNLAVLGPNGAGKSTFLRLIAGTEIVNRGRIWSNTSISWPLGIGSGFQAALTGRQNVMFACRINGLSRSQTKQVIDEVMDFAELREYFDQPLSTYSSGMRARLSFGLSMAFEFEVYLIDELTSVGDAIFRAKAKQAFADLRSRASIIFVSHNLQTLRESCNSALFLHDGTAAYFDDIESGIKAYEAYILDNRIEHAAEVDALDRANRQERRKLRLERQSARNSEPPSDPPAQGT